MLTKIKGYVFKGLSTIVGVCAFLLLLPLTFGMVLLTIIASVATIFSVRYQAGKSEAGFNSCVDTTSQQTHEHSQKPPIEGSYTVID